MTTRFAIATLGCKVNQYDSAIIESRLSARGMERREFTEQADVYIVNTCTITDRADAESLRIARRARRLNPKARVVMTGCLAQASPEVLFARIQKRAVPMELQISDAYLHTLCDAYNEFFYHYDRTPVLTVNAEHLNPLDSDADLALLAERIETMRGRKEFFVKGTSL